MKTKKMLVILLCASTVLLMLTGCGSRKKEQQAAELAAAGQYEEAYKIYQELDNITLMKQLREDVSTSAEHAMDENDYDRAVELLTPFKNFNECSDLYKAARLYQQGTYIADLTVDGNNISFTLARGEEQKDYSLRIKLKANNDVVQGTIFAVLKAEELPEENPCQMTLNLNDLYWQANPNYAFSFYDNSIFTVTTQVAFQGGLVKFYKVVRNDGTEGLSMGMQLSTFHFNDTAKTFNGGSVFVGLFNPDRTIEQPAYTDSYTGEKSAELPG